jgi:hypothetical protein
LWLLLTGYNIRVLLPRRPVVKGRTLQDCQAQPDSDDSSQQLLVWGVASMGHLPRVGLHHQRVHETGKLSIYKQIFPLKLAKPITWIGKCSGSFKEILYLALAFIFQSSDSSYRRITFTHVSWSNILEKQIWNLTIIRVRNA